MLLPERVGRGDPGIHRQVRIRQQPAARHRDAERQVSLHLPGVVDAGDRHGHRVADLDVAANRAGDRHAGSDTFRRIDDVVRRDGVEDDARHRRQGVDRLCVDQPLHRSVASNWSVLGATRHDHVVNGEAVD